MSSANQAEIDSWVRVAGRVYEDVERAQERAGEIVRMEGVEKVCFPSTREGRRRGMYGSKQDEEG